MLYRFLFLVLLLSVLTLISCTNERRISYETAYIVNGDSLRQVEKDSLTFEKDSVNILIQGKKHKIEGNILEISFSGIPSGGKPANSIFYYSVYNNQNKILAELYASDKDNDGSFDSFTASGNIKLIPEKVGKSWINLYDVINEDIKSLQNKAKKKIVDASTGKEIKEED